MCNTLTLYGHTYYGMFSMMHFTVWCPCTVTCRTLGLRGTLVQPYVIRVYGEKSHKLLTSFTHGFWLVSLDRVDHLQPLQLHLLKSRPLKQARTSTLSTNRSLRQRDQSCRGYNASHTEQRVNRYGGQIRVLHPLDRFWWGVGSRLQVLLVRVLRDPFKVLEVQAVLMSCKDVRVLVVQDALRDATQHSVNI